jgi:hypothetical protein
VAMSPRKRKNHEAAVSRQSSARVQVPHFLEDAFPVTETPFLHRKYQINSPLPLLRILRNIF